MSVSSLIFETQFNMALCLALQLSCVSSVFQSLGNSEALPCEDSLLSKSIAENTSNLWQICLFIRGKTKHIKCVGDYYISNCKIYKKKKIKEWQINAFISHLIILACTGIPEDSVLHGFPNLSLCLFSSVQYQVLP